MKSLLVWIFLIVPWFAQAQFQVPALQGPVMDLANVMTAKDRQIVEGLLRDFHQRGKGQIQVLTVPNLGGQTIEQASIEIVDKWKLGDAKRDDGVLLLVALEERKIRIEVGQGLEGVLPDITAKQIVQDVMAPFFRQGIPSQGVLQGTLWIVKTIDPEFQTTISQAAPRQRTKESPWSKYEGLFILLFVLFMIFGNLFRPRRRSFWGGGGGWGGGGFGGFGGGGGGGGWSGGGGGFSGGGASGSW